MKEHKASERQDRKCQHQSQYGFGVSDADRGDLRQRDDLMKTSAQGGSDQLDPGFGEFQRHREVKPHMRKQKGQDSGSSAPDLYVIRPSFRDQHGSCRQGTISEKKECGDRGHGNSLWLRMAGNFSSFPFIIYRKSEGETKNFQMGQFHEIFMVCLGFFLKELAGSLGKCGILRKF